MASVTSCPAPQLPVGSPGRHATSSESSSSYSWLLATATVTVTSTSCPSHQLPVSSLGPARSPSSSDSLPPPVPGSEEVPGEPHRPVAAGPFLLCPDFLSLATTSCLACRRALPGPRPPVPRQAPPPQPAEGGAEALPEGGRGRGRGLWCGRGLGRGRGCGRGLTGHQQDAFVQQGPTYPVAPRAAGPGARIAGQRGRGAR